MFVANMFFFFPEPLFRFSSDYILTLPFSHSVLGWPIALRLAVNGNNVD